MADTVALLPRQTVYNTVGSDLDLNGNGKVSCSPNNELEPILEFLLGVVDSSFTCTLAKAIIFDSLYQNLRRVRAVRITFNLFGVIAFIEPVFEPVAQGNDILITRKSARGPQNYQDIVTYSREYDGSIGRNHLSVVDAGVAADVADWLEQIEQSHPLSDMRLFIRKDIHPKDNCDRH